MNELHLFAGAGGGILGGVLLGHTTVCAVEIEPYCQKVLLQRQRDGILPKFPIWDDVRTFDGKPWRGKVDCVCGGFPCQDISSAGKGAGIEGARSGLWSEFARIIGEVRPKFAFVENSPMLTIRGLGRVLGDLSEMGYDAEWCVLGADDCGAPHERKRIWILAYSQGERQRIRGESRSVFEKNGRPLGKLLCESISTSFANAQNLHNTSGERGIKVELQAHTAQGTQPLIGEYNGANSLRYATWWTTDPADEDGAFESQLGRVANGVDNRVDRLKAIGNGQVPIVAATAFRILMDKIKKI